jgi:DNA polymerase elongation subunit (family B)
MIKKIHEIDYRRSETFVYDFTTQNHHFSAGVGRMVVHNTDSVMFTIPEADRTVTDLSDPVSMQNRMNYVFEQGAAICNYISAQLPDALVFELEGVLHPSIYYKKKNYTAKSWESPTDKPKLKLKGVCAVRNDRSILNKRLSNQILQMTVMDNNVQGAYEYLKAEVTKLKQNQLQMSDFVISKNLKDFKPKNKSPHVTAALRLPEHERPVLGEKIEYVITNFRGADISEKARVVSQATVFDMDRNWYFDTQIKKPILELLEPLGTTAQLKQDLINIMQGQTSLATLFGSNNPVKFRAKPKRKPKAEATDETQNKIGKYFK